MTLRCNRRNPSDAVAWQGHHAAKKFAIALAAMVALVMLAPRAALAGREGPASEWNWELSPERYKKMAVFERAQYDKAAGLLRDKSYKAAATEFEKLKEQFPDSPNMSRIVLLHAYSLHLAKTRLAAIKIYNEILDYFGDTVDDAAPAIYLMGIAHMENGDTAKGLRTLKDMVDNEKYQKHPLAAGALRQVADDLWKRGEYDSAVNYWKQAVRDFSRSNAQEALISREDVTAWYFFARDYAGYDAWRLDAKTQNDPKTRAAVATHIVTVAWNIATGQGNYTYPMKKERDAKENAAKLPDDLKACWAYFKVAKAQFEKNNDLWGYYSTGVNFLGGCVRDKKELEDVVVDLVAFVKAIPDKAAADGKWCWLIDRSCEWGDYTRANYFLPNLSDKFTAAWKGYEILASQKKWKEALSHLELIEGMGNEPLRARAMETRAAIYKDCVGEYEKAIKLYTDINKPPGTLWAIQECQYRLNRLDVALTQLTEIENMFPAEAPEAAWTKAMYLDRAKREKECIAQGRRILKLYPKSPASSRAHLLLEKYGIKPGGGLKDDDDQ